MILLKKPKNRLKEVQDLRTEDVKLQKDVNELLPQKIKWISMLAKIKYNFNVCPNSVIKIWWCQSNNCRLWCPLADKEIISCFRVAKSSIPSSRPWLWRYTLLENTMSCWLPVLSIINLRLRTTIKPTPLHRVSVDPNNTSTLLNICLRRIVNLRPWLANLRKTRNTVSFRSVMEEFFLEKTKSHQLN